MPRFTVVAIEKFKVRTTYLAVEAQSEKEAEVIVMGGYAAYDSHRILDGDEEYVGTESIEREEDED